MQNKPIYACIYPLVIIAIFFCNFSMDVYAQSGSISGRVRSENNMDLAYAYVKLESSKKGGITDENGHFILKEVPAGNHILQISALGSKTQKKDISLKDGQHL